MCSFCFLHRVLAEFSVEILSPRSELDPIPESENYSTVECRNAKKGTNFEICRDRGAKNYISLKTVKEPYGALRYESFKAFKKCLQCMNMLASQ
jgi:hypothetical protein